MKNHRCRLTRLMAGMTAMLMLLAVLPAYAQPAPGQEDYQDGIYQDLAPGYGDDVIITLIVRAGRIVSLDAKNRNGGESEYFWKARDGMAEAVVRAQAIEGVETVAGATGTSSSILAALEKMREQLLYSGQPGEATAGEP